ncbi:MAG: family intrarane metalloprotease protein [Candidatus Acidoferrum typicum]|nr:family intrarane metalloprotease protein [Candidatus Acidoferrum typicum]
MKRLADFLRSVMPEDPAQLLFLAGTVCLVIAPRLSWWPAGFQLAPEHQGDWLNRQIGALGGVIFFPILFAGIAGYFIAFWPGPQPVRRILSCVYLPTVPILAILCLRFVHLVRPHRSVLEAVGPHTRPWPEFPLLRVPGLQFCLTGLLLIGIFTGRLMVRRSSLPLALPRASLLRDDDPGTWRRTQILIWVLIGPLFLTTAFIAVPLTLSPHFLQYVQSVWFSRLGIPVQMLLFLAVATCLIGKSAATMLRSALRLPSEKYAVLAVLFSIGIPSLITLGQYLWERAQLVRHDVGTVVWEPGTYFHFPEAWALLLFFPALFEEIIFRGFLQPRFVQRYGLLRGVFLVGIVWAAFHFPSDISFSHFGFWAAIRSVCFRLFICIALSFVLGWLTLETGSVLAAALAHTFYNVLFFSELGTTLSWKEFVVRWSVGRVGMDSVSLLACET